MMSPSNIAHSLRQYERRLDHYPIFNLPYLVHVRRAKPLRAPLELKTPYVPQWIPQIEATSHALMVHAQSSVLYAYLQGFVVVLPVPVAAKAHALMTIGHCEQYWASWCASRATQEGLPPGGWLADAFQVASPQEVTAYMQLMQEKVMHDMLYQTASHFLSPPEIAKNTGTAWDKLLWEQSQLVYQEYPTLFRQGRWLSIIHHWMDEPPVLERGSDFLD